MLVNSKKILNDARMNNYAIAHFNINNLEWTRFILEECERLKTPVILGVSESAIDYMGGYYTVANLVKSLISDLKINIPVILHLDHGKKVESCIKAIDAGFTSVMIDASTYPITENIRMTKKVVEYAKKHNVTVEAELGHVGSEADKSLIPELYTEVDAAKKFVEETKIDSLAPAIGNAHGLYTGKIELDFERIKEIAKITNVPLVLHGASYIPDDMLKKAVKSGINKVNINTELQIAWANDVKSFIEQNQDIYDPRKIIKAGEKAIKSIIKQKLEILNRN